MRRFIAQRVRSNCLKLETAEKDYFDLTGHIAFDYFDLARN